MNVLPHPGYSIDLAPPIFLNITEINNLGDYVINKENKYYLD